MALNLPCSVAAGHQVRALQVHFRGGAAEMVVNCHGRVFNYVDVERSNWTDTRDLLWRSLL